MEILQQKSNPTVKQLREMPIGAVFTVEELAEMAEDQGVPGLKPLLAPYLDQEICARTTLGELADTLAGDPNMKESLNTPIPYKFRVEQIIDLLGWENVRRTLQDTLGEASFMPEYETSRSNIAICWAELLLRTMLYAALATVTLEFIDKDKR